MHLDQRCDAVQRGQTDLADEIARLAHQIAALQLRARHCNSSVGIPSASAATVVWPHASAQGEIPAATAATPAAVLPPKPPGAVRFLCISDTHNQHSSVAELKAGVNVEVDVLLHAGDATNSGTLKEITAFADWLDSLDWIQHKILVPGNHDLTADKHFYDRSWRDWHGCIGGGKNAGDSDGDGDDAEATGGKEDAAECRARLRKSCTVLADGAVTVLGCTVYGNSAQPRQPKQRRQMAFGMTRGTQLKAAWRKIPNAVDVLVTHTPPQGIRDAASTQSSKPVGCEELRKRLRIDGASGSGGKGSVLDHPPALHVFGHVHDGYGWTQGKRTLFVNASSVTQPRGGEGRGCDVNPAIIVDVVPLAAAAKAP